MSRDVRKRTRGAGLDLDPVDCAIIVYYDVEYVTLDATGTSDKVVRVEEKSTRVVLRTLTPQSNVARHAEDVLRKCKYISPAEQPRVEQLLRRLQLRLQESRNDELDGLGDDDRRRLFGEDLGEAQMERLHDYLELLYEGQDGGKEDMTEKIRGTAMMLKLCYNVENLEILIQNGPVMSALSRVLRDEFKKSMDVAYNIVRIFLAFSNFCEMHPILSETYRVGALMLSIVDFEVQRIRRIQNGDQENKSIEEKRLAENDRDQYESTEKRRAREAARTKVFTVKQDRLLFAALYVLINLAENGNVERKMIKKNLIDHLVFLLDRSSVDLVVMICAFLKKLSIIEENVDTIVDLDVVPKIVRLIPCSNDTLTQMALRLIFNLSFHPTAREDMIKASLLPRLVGLLRVKTFRERVIRLMYHLSSNDRCKALFANTDAVPIVMKFLLQFPTPQVPEELGALAVNLSINARNAELMARGGGLRDLIERLCGTKDRMLAKVARNIALWTYNLQADANANHHEQRDYRQRQLWCAHVRPLLSLCTQPDASSDLIVEVMGILAGLTLDDLPQNVFWGDLIQEYQLTSLIIKLLVPGMSEPDMALEVVLFVAVLATDAEAAPLLASSQLIRCLYDLMKDKGDDAEIVLQLLLCFRRLCVHDSTREELFLNTRAVVDIMSYLKHENPRVRDAADACLQVVLECDPTGPMGQQIRRRRFESYNKTWVEAMQLDGVSFDGAVDEDGQYDSSLGEFKGEYNFHDTYGRKLKAEESLRSSGYLYDDGFALDVDGLNSADYTSNDHGELKGWN